MRLAHVVLDAAGAKVRTGEAVGDGVVLRDDADVLRAIDEDAVAREELLHFVERDEQFVAELADAFEPAGREVARLAADARVARRESRAGEALAEIVDLLALGERVQE